MTTDVPDSKTYVHALIDLAHDGIIRGELSMSRIEAFILWWLALGAGILGVIGAGALHLRRESIRLARRSR